MPRHTFRDLATVVDDLHALVDGWAAAGTFAPDVDEDGVEVLRLVLHEWMANLVQHAVFPGAVDIALEVQHEAGGVRCAVEDTSAGFDLLAQIDQQRSVLDAPGPSERGRGLLMLVTCTEDLTFVPATGDAPQRIAFRVRPPVAEQTVLSGLFRPDDLLADLPPDLAPDPGCGASPYGGLSEVTDADLRMSSGGDGAAPHPAAPRR